MPIMSSFLDESVRLLNGLLLICTPASLITLLHFASSLAMKRPNSAGVLVSGSAPMAAK